MRRVKSGMAEMMQDINGLTNQKCFLSETMVAKEERDQRHKLLQRFLRQLGNAVKEANSLS